MKLANHNRHAHNHMLKKQNRIMTRKNNETLVYVNGTSKMLFASIKEAMEYIKTSANNWYIMCNPDYELKVNPVYRKETVATAVSHYLDANNVLSYFQPKKLNVLKRFI